MIMKCKNLAYIYMSPKCKDLAVIYMPHPDTCFFKKHPKHSKKNVRDNGNPSETGRAHASKRVLESDAD